MTPSALMRSSVRKLIQSTVAPTGSGVRILHLALMLGAIVLAGSHIDRQGLLAVTISPSFRLLAPPQNPGLTLGQAALFRDGTGLIAYDRNYRQLYVWSFPSRVPVRTIPVSSEVIGLQVDRNKKYVLSNSTLGATVYSITSGAALCTTRAVARVGLREVGSSVVFGSVESPPLAPETADLVERALPSGVETRRIRLSARVGAQVFASWSPDGSRFAVGTGDAEIAIVDRSGGTRYIKAAGSTIGPLLWERSGTLLLGGSFDWELWRGRVWLSDLRSGALRWVVGPGPAFQSGVCWNGSESKAYVCSSLSNGQVLLDRRNGRSGRREARVKLEDPTVSRSAFGPALPPAGMAWIAPPGIVRVVAASGQVFEWK